MFNRGLPFVLPVTSAYFCTLLTSMPEQVKKYILLGFKFKLSPILVMSFTQWFFWSPFCVLYGCWQYLSGQLRQCMDWIMVESWNSAYLHKCMLLNPIRVVLPFVLIPIEALAGVYLNIFHHNAQALWALAQCLFLYCSLQHGAGIDQAFLGRQQGKGKLHREWRQGPTLGRARNDSSESVRVLPPAAVTWSHKPVALTAEWCREFWKSSCQQLLPSEGCSVAFLKSGHLLALLGLLKP